MSGGLEVSGVSAGYGPVRVLRDVTLHARSNEITVMIGPNGAGKSTLLKAIAGFLKLARGRISFGQLDLVGLPPHRILRNGLLYIPQGRSVFPDLSVEENLSMGAFSLKTRVEVEEARERAYEMFPRLRDRRKQAGGSLSGGERRFVELARVVMLNPRLVLLDEPSLGVAPRIMDEIYEAISRLHATGVGFLIVEQNVARALQAASLVHVLALGHVEWSGSPDALRGNASLRQLYLGDGATSEVRA